VSRAVREDGATDRPKQDDAVAADVRVLGHHQHLDEEAVEHRLTWRSWTTLR
jgi:hypothetical protein